MSTIKRDIEGLSDFFVDRMEELADDRDMDVEKKIKLSAICNKEIRGLASLNIQYKKLVLRSPDVARNEALVLPVGTPAQLESK